MRNRMYGGVRGRKTKKVGRNSKIFVFLLLDLCHNVIVECSLRLLLVLEPPLRLPIAYDSCTQTS